MVSKNVVDVISYGLLLVLCRLNWHRVFDVWEKHGFHVTSNHFHMPIPDTRLLGDKLWKSKSELVGIKMNVTKQLELLTQVFPVYQKEYEFPRTETDTPNEYYVENGAFGSFDAEVLHCMIRHYQPKKIVEVGSGFSTLVSANASKLNKEDGVKTELFAVEPYPNVTLKKGFPGLTELIQKPVEQVDLDYFSQLGENDILFIDSSHVVKIGSDVNYLYLEVLPRLKKGVIVHVHDIFFPSEYPKGWVLSNHVFWSEQYLLQAFLTFNYAFEVLWASYYMHQKYPNELKSAFPCYDSKKVTDNIHDFMFSPPASFWFKKTV